MKPLLFIFILLLNFSAGFAQQNYIRYTVKDGLPQMQCMTLFQDSRGYIWIGTKGGVSRFDGISFQNYTKEDGLLNNLVNEITEDKDGNILIVNPNGISVLKNDKISTYKIKDKSVIHAIDYTNPDTVFLKVTEKGNMHLKYFTNKQFYDFDIIGGDSVGYFTYDKKNDQVLYVKGLGNDKRLLYLFSDGKRHLLFPNTGEIILYFQKDEYGNVYVTNYNRKKNLSSVYLLEEERLEFLFEVKDRFSHCINTGKEQIIDRRYGLTFIRNGKQTNENIDNSVINDILPDKEGNLWIATETGLYKKVPFYNFFPKGDTLKYVWSISEDKNANLWFATFGNGLYRMNEDFHFEKFPKYKNTSFYFGAIKTRTDRLIFPAANLESVILENSGASYNVKELAGTATLSVFEDVKHKRILYGTNHGLFVQNARKEMLHYPEFNLNGKGYIKKIIKDGFGRIWFATSYGLGRFKDDINTDNFAEFSELPVKNAVDIYCDKKNNLWLACENGLFFYDYKKFTKINHPELNGMIGSVTAADDTHLVYGGLRGIGILDLEKFYAKLSKGEDLSKAFEYVDYYTQSDGFLGEEVGQNGIFRDTKGRVWVPTNTNVVMFRPSDLRKNTKPPDTHINDVHVSEDNINRALLPDSVTVLNHKQSNIRIDYIGICLTSPELVNYKYRLKGFNDTWSNEVHERYVTYTNLPPGRYAFELSACNNGGVWNETPVRRNFIIRAAWWQTLVFRIFAAIFILFVALYVFYRFQKRKRKKTELANRLNTLQMQSVQAQIYPHLLFNTTSAAGSVIYKEEKEKAYDFLVKVSQLMRKALTDTKRLYKSIQEELNFVENYLQIQKIRFPERFDYTISVGKDVDTLSEVPQMIIQTYTENAVKYGLEPLKGGGLLQISVEKVNEKIVIVVEDNGIGIEAAKKLSHKGTGSGIKIMNEIYEIHNRQKKNKISFVLIDLYKEGKKGTKVIVEINLRKDGK